MWMAKPPTAVTSTSRSRSGTALLGAASGWGQIDVALVGANLGWHGCVSRACQQRVGQGRHLPRREHLVLLWQVPTLVGTNVSAARATRVDQGRHLPKRRRIGALWQVPTLVGTNVSAARANSVSTKVDTYPGGNTSVLLW